MRCHTTKLLRPTRTRALGQPLSGKGQAAGGAADAHDNTNATAAQAGWSYPGQPWKTLTNRAAFGQRFFI
jgi:hypothetical protein